MIRLRNEIQEILLIFYVLHREFLLHSKQEKFLLKESGLVNFKERNLLAHEDLHGRFSNLASKIEGFTILRLSHDLPTYSDHL